MAVNYWPAAALVIKLSYPRFISKVMSLYVRFPKRRALLFLVL